MPMTNTRAYYATATFTAVKSFIVQAPAGVNLIILPFFLTDSVTK
jgi:hypothetical protein